MSSTPSAASARTPLRGALAALLLLAVLAPAALLGQDRGRLEARLQARLDSLVAPASIPGMTLGVSLPDGSTLALAAGMADTARAQPMDPEALMLQGSVGKTYFGAVALQLVAEGRLDLDRPVADYLGHHPWWGRIPNGATATVRDLMRHTSGIVRYEFNPAFLEDLTAEPLRTFTPEERLAYLFDTEAPFPAGAGWEYSDTNYILLAMVVEEITGRPAYAEIRRRILEPWVFDHTVPSDRPEIPGLAQGYAGVGNPFGGVDAMVVDGRLAINPQFEWGGGGFASSARDLARWIHVLQEGRAFDPALLPEYRDGRSAPPLGSGVRYGLGVILREMGHGGAAWGHSGFMPGYRTEAWYYPEGGFALALQINTTAPRAFPAPPRAMIDGLAAVVRQELASR